VPQKAAYLAVSTFKTSNVQVILTGYGRTACMFSAVLTVTTPDSLRHRNGLFNVDLKALIRFYKQTARNRSKLH
jgi:hypothetical protein